MTDRPLGSVEEPETRKFCPWCGSGVASPAGYCGDCGRPLTDANGDNNGADDYQAAPAPAGTRSAFPTQPPPTAGYPYPYAPAYPAPIERRTQNVGLIVGLVAAVLLALGAIVAVVLVASAGGSSGPTISTASTAAVVPNSSSPAGTAPASNPGPSPVSHASTSAATSFTTAASQAAPPSQSGSAADADSIRAVVQQHWALINSSNFDAAFGQMDPNDYVRSSWIQGEESDAPIQASVSVGQPTFSSSTSASVPVISLHTVASDGCADWSGSYGMEKINGAWLISNANLQKSAC
jgi:hypothetical protein